MESGQPATGLDGYFRRHPRILVATNLVLLILVTINLLITTEAPVVLYQAF